jgi:hypothetical protein
VAMLREALLSGEPLSLLWSRQMLAKAGVS